MKNILKVFLSILFLIIVVSAGYFYFVLFPKHTVPIFTYHNIANIDHHEPNWISPANFDKQMAFLKKNNYNVITLGELIENIDKDKIPSKTVVLTFDDGNENNYSHAFPILKKYGFKATIFLIGSVLLFTEQRNFKFINEFGEQYPMSIEEAKEMLSYGIEMGSHSLNHYYLPEQSYDVQRTQIFGNKKILEDKLGVPIQFFAYPIGGFTNETKQLVKEAGYKAACTTNRGYNPLNKDLFQIIRIRMTNKDNDFSIFAKASGFFNAFRQPKASY